jgi:hypothetical protein
MMHRFWKMAIIAGALLLLAVGTIALLALPGPPRRLLARSLPSGSPVPASPVDSQVVVFPSSGQVEMGVEYRYTLYTHCGLDGAVDFDGSLWDFAGPGPADDGSHSPPAEFDNPFDHGTMKLVSEDVAEYRSASNLVVTYSRRLDVKRLELCS